MENRLTATTPEPAGLRRRHALTWAAACGAPLWLAGCQPPAAALRVGSIVFPGYELMFLARELGLFDARQVRLVELYSNTDTLRALAAGQLEAAALTLDELMTARADGVDLRAVAVLDVSLGADVVLARAPVTLKTLVGKRVGVEEGGTGAVMLSALLGATQLTLNQVHKVSITMDRSEEFYHRGLVDVVVTAEPWAARLEKAGAKRIFDSTSIPGRIVDVLAVRADAMKPGAAALRKLLAGHFQAMKYLQAKPEDAGVRMARRLSTPAHEVMNGFKGLQLPDAAMNRAMLRQGGTIDQSTQALQQVMQSAGLLRTVSPLGALADASFLPS